MPYILKEIVQDEVKIDETPTLILDVQQTKVINKNIDESKYVKGISVKEINELKDKYADIEFFQDVVQKSDVEWESILKQIENVEEFYNLVWERTLLELIFITQFFINSISEPKSFELLSMSNTEFDFWFSNNVEYTMLERIKDFYVKTIESYANQVSIDIYESDTAQKTKEILEKIESGHLSQLKKVLNNAWNEASENYKEWLKKEEEKRKTIIFD